MSDSLQPHGLQHARLSCPSWSPGVCSDSCPLSLWCHPTISFSASLFSFWPQSFPPSRSFLMNRPWTWVMSQEVHRRIGKRKPQVSAWTAKNGKPQETGKYQGDYTEKGNLGNKLMMLSSNFWAHRQARHAWIRSQTKLQDRELN